MQKGQLNINSAMNHLIAYYNNTKTSFMMENKYTKFSENWNVFKIKIFLIYLNL